MKVKTESALFTVPFGSHLYGTNGPTSDLDFKVVCLPPHDVLLLNYKVTNRCVKPEGVGSSGKMIAGEAEYEYIPLQIFFDDFLDGQTYALEIAFAVIQDKAMIGDRLITEVYKEAQAAKDDTTMQMIEHIYLWVEELINKFLTKNVKKMVGYAVSQAKNYGLKTERYNTIKRVYDMLDEFVKRHEYLSNTLTKLPLVSINKLALRDCPDLINDLLQIEHVCYCEILNGSGGTEMSPALDVCGKQHSYTNSVGTIHKSVKGALATYGDRVKKFDGEGVDWKALSHAIRITEQVIELSTTGKLTFPRPTFQFLKDVKDGKMTVDAATEYLTARFNEVDNVVDKSILPERTTKLEEEFTQFKLRVLRSYYD